MRTPMLREQEDPTRIELETTNVWDNPFDIKYGIRGTAIHGDTPFEAPWISHIVGNLYQGDATVSSRFRLTSSMS